MAKEKKPKILFYDIETLPLKAYVWRTGKQYINYKQLEVKQYNIICITYCWNDSKPGKALVFDYKTQDCTKVIKQFDELVVKADITIGKNSDRFDTKHINTQRMLTQDYGMPDWTAHTDDLEKQLRKHFYLPSFSLDYISELLGFGGKDSMEMRDWINILEQTKDGRKSLKKMVKYGIKDVEDTRSVWNRLSKHFKPKFNMATFAQDHVCVNCGSKKIHKNGTRQAGKTKYQNWFCRSHGGFAGRTPIKWTSKSDIGKPS